MVALSAPAINVGREYRPKGEPLEVDTHDFPDKELGKAIPYGVYDIHQNEAWVSVGISRDTAEFAVEAIRRWWKRLGKKRYRQTRRILITADSGGSNGNRNRLWKYELQQLANETGLVIEVIIPTCPRYLRTRPKRIPLFFFHFLVFPLSSRRPITAFTACSRQPPVSVQ